TKSKCIYFAYFNLVDDARNSAAGVYGGSESHPVPEGRAWSPGLGLYHGDLQNNQKNFPALCTVADVTLPDSNSLQNFHTKCSQTASEKKWEGEFLDGFADDLLEAMRSINVKRGGMVIGDFQRINRREIIVPFTPPEPYSFQCFLSNNQTSYSSQMQACGQIKVVEKIRNQNGCPCQSSNADDMVCLLHGDNEKVKTQTVDACDGPFCHERTPFLSKSHISRWFQSTIKLAWGLISHKYQFELSFCSIDVLTIRFRSGKKISFKMKPVVKSNEAHFSITPWPSNDPDSLWTLSLTTYEEQLLQHFSKQLPENSCHLEVLEIALFLHRRQKALTGSSALKEFHFKTALLHLLLSKDPAQWKPNDIVSRLRDLFRVIETSLENKVLNHPLVGNPSTAIELPAEFTKAKPVNLFHPLVVHECMHRNAAAHFQEMLRNTRLIIDDYTSESTQNDPHEATLRRL
uniref:Inositol 1,4,5-trisphosphate receptor-interacting protein n=1 Tax=Salarias fasciatus TaxID=181472 RepID=A0A672GNY7_SALFA